MNLDLDGMVKEQVFTVLQEQMEFGISNLFVRGNMTVNELTVNEIKAGWAMLVTLADIECSNVVDSSEGWLCYFKDEDGIYI